MPISNWFAGKVLDSAFRAQAWPTVAPWVALHTADPGAIGDASTEVAGGSYARLKPTFSAASNRATANSTAVTFQNMPAVTVTHIAVWSAVTGGNMLFYGALASSAVIASGGRYTVNASDLALVLN